MSKADIKAAKVQQNDEALAKLREETNATIAKTEGPTSSEPGETEDAPPTSPTGKPVSTDTPKPDEAAGQDAAQPPKPDQATASDSDVEQLPDDEKKALREKAQKRFKTIAEQNREMRKELAEIRKTREQAATQQPTYPQPTQQPVQPSPAYQLPWLRGRGPVQPQSAPEVEALRNEVFELKAQRIIDDYHKDLTEMERKHPELNEDSPDYDEELADHLSLQFLAMRQANPDTRLLTFVDKAMEIISKQREDGKSEASATIAEQAAEQTGGTGTGGKPSSGKTVIDEIKEAKSITELQALKGKINKTAS